MFARSSWARTCARLVVMLAAFLGWNTMSVSSATAQGGYPYQIFLYDVPPYLPYEVTSTYANSHVTDRYSNVIYVNIDQNEGHVYDLEYNLIGFLGDPTTAFQPALLTTKTVPMPAFLCWNTMTPSSAGAQKIRKRYEQTSDPNVKQEVSKMLEASEQVIHWYAALP